VSEKQNLKRTALYEAHVKAGARLVPFAGYEMPVQYSGVIDEHRAVRETVGLFDVSHMGEIEFRGPKALDVVNRIITNDLEAVADGQACYTVMVKPEGGIIDDLIVYRFSRDRIFIVVNASNRKKDFAWMVEQANGECDVVDRSDDFALIAVQGPKAVELVSRLAEQDVSGIQRFRFVVGAIAGKQAMIARTGYTGEDGFELYLESKDALHVWYQLLEKGSDLGVKPVGLGARDSLRLEMKYALYGNDIDETTNPFEAGLGWTVKLKKREFVGKQALEQIKADGPERTLVGFELSDRGIARAGYAVMKDGKKIGEVKSGTMGPSVEKAIGTAYVPAQYAAPGTVFEIEIRGKPVKATVVKTPFYSKGA
jgi:aminomethyltransferase